jgi:hypothetical protein
MNNKTKLIYRIKYLINRCREKGKWNLAIQLRDKYLV